MVSNWILDISIGCVLLISIGLFYETTVIFYTMFNWWMIIFLLPFGAVYSLFAAVYSLIEQSKKLSGNESEAILHAKSIQPAEQYKQYTLIGSIAIAIMWLIPIVVDLMFGGTAIFTAHLLNSNLHLDDVYLICLTPALLLLITCFSEKLRKMLSNNINSSIYSSLGSIGVVANTFVVEWGGYSVAKILDIAS
jgi:membrane protein implicated in regulation of membrane protease activity